MSTGFLLFRYIIVFIDIKLFLWYNLYMQIFLKGVLLFMTTMNTQNNTFEFRTKFAKLLTAENRPVITEVCAKFCAYPPEYAFNILWNMTLANDIATRTIELLGLNPEIIPCENISTFRNELRYQYEKLNPDFLKVDVSEEYQEAFETLKNHADSIVATTVFEHCCNTLYEGEESVKRILFLLNSEKENLYYGGLRALHFCDYEANHLKQFHEQIHNLLSVMFNHHYEHISNKNTPFEGLSERLTDAGIQIPFDLQEKCSEFAETAPEENQPEKVADEAPIQVVTPAFKPLTPEEVLAHKDVFTSFARNDDMNLLLQIGQLDFDLNQVIAKKIQIANLLTAAEALSM